MLIERQAAGRVEAGAGFVEQQQARLVQQGAGDFHPPAVAAIEVADLVVAALAQLLAGQFGVDALARQGRGHAVQGGVVAQVLFHAQVQVQGALLKHHTELAQGLAWLAAQAVAEHLDLALLQVVEAGE